MIRELTPDELDQILSTIDRERHFLYYSYLTIRRPNTIHFGQHSERGELLGVLAFLRGLPFHAFSVYPLAHSFQIGPLLSFARTRLSLPDGATGSFIVNGKDLADLEAQLRWTGPPRELLLMKHVREEALPLPSEGPQVQLLDASYFDRIEAKQREWNAMAFSREELNYPFYGVTEQGELVAAGGYHVFTDEYAELGNIGTDVARRRRGLGTKVCAELTRHGRAACAEVYLNVLTENEGAVRLYESLGYEIVCRQYIAEFAVEG